MLRALLALVILSLLLPGALVADEQAPTSSLLERLSAETAGLVAHADARLAHLSSEGRTWHGVLAGSPPRFVVALVGPLPEGGMPEQARLTLADGSVREATRADADAEVGLAVYEVSGAAVPAFALAAGGPPRRGALAVVGGAVPALRAVEQVEGALDDLGLGEAEPGAPAVAPDGTLLALRAGPALGCAACHWISVDVDGTAVALPWNGVHCLLGNTLLWRSRAADLTIVPSDGVRTAYADGLARWLASSRQFVANGGQLGAAMPALPALLRAQWLNAVRGSLTLGRQGLGSAPASAPSAPGGWVPAAVIERALADVSSSRGRFARAFLGVVIDGPVLDASGTLPWAWQRALTLGESLWVSSPPRPIGPDVAQEAGVRIGSVLPDSPAARAGLEKGLRIVELDGRPLEGAAAFARALARRRPGERVRLSVEGWAAPVEVVLGDREQDARGLASAFSVGLAVQGLTPELARFLNLPAEAQGLVVREVRPDSPAAAAGFLRGDLIVDGGGGPVRDEGELDAVLGAAKESVLLGVARGAERLSVQLQVPAAPVSPRVR